jgi:hypothetical protein
LPASCKVLPAMLKKQILQKIFELAINVFM